MYKYLLLFLLTINVCFGFQVHYDKLSVGDTRTTLTGSVSLNMFGTTLASKPWPSMTTTQRDALTTVEGMVVYNTTTMSVETYNGSAWVGFVESISGSGVAEEITFFSGTNTLSSSSNFTFDGTNTTVAGTITAANFVGNGSGLTNIDTSNLTIGASDVAVRTLSGSTYDNLEDIFNNTQSAGLISGGDVTDGGTGTIDISAGSGILKTTDSNIGVNVAFTFAGTSSLSLTDDSINWIYIDYNGGAPTYGAVTKWTTLDLHTQIIIAKVWRDGNDVHIVKVCQCVEDFNRKLMQYNYELLGIHRTSGLVVSATGTLNINITAGVMYEAFSRLTTSAVDTSGAGFFKYVYKDGGTGWTYTATDTLINALNYDDGDGVLGEIGVSKYGVNWVYMHSNGDVFIQYGVGSYSRAEVKLATVPAGPEFVTGFGVLVAKLIILRGGTTFAVESAFETTFIPSMVTNHNDLSNLQGGAAGDYYHLKLSELNAMIDGAGTATQVSLFSDGGTITSDADLTFDGDSLVVGGTVTATAFAGDGSALTGLASGANKFISDVTLDGTVSLKSVDTSGDITDARNAIIQFRDNSNAYEVLGVTITSTEGGVTITSTPALDAGSYRLILLEVE